MKKIILSLVVVAVSLTACKETKEKTAVAAAVVETVNVATLNNVDATTSVLNWKGTKPTGAHNGTVSLKNGGMLVEEGMLKEGTFAIDMNTITVLDIPVEKEGNAKLVGHLKNSDFFSVETHPLATFVITAVEKKETNLHVTGNLTVKGITKSITIPATVSTENGITTFASETFTIDRSDFDVRYGSKKFFDNLKDKFIDDLIELSFVVKTKA